VRHILSNTVESDVEYVISYVSGDEDIATVDSDGIVDYVSNGNVDITISTGDQIDKVNLSMSTSSSVATSTLTSYVTSSLASHSCAQIDSRISGSHSSSMQMFTAFPAYPTYNPSYPFARNENVWTNDVDLTGMCMYQWTGLTRVFGTLIDRRHVVFAAHAAPVSNAILYFIGANNEVFTASFIDHSVHNEYNAANYPLTSDIYVGTLSTDAPSYITPVKVLPSNWKSKFSNISPSSSIACAKVNQFQQVTVVDMSATIGEEYSSLVEFCSPKSINKDRRNEFYKSTISGDSGSPVFLILNGEAVLVGLTTYMNPLTVTDISQQNMTAFINSVSSHTASLSTVDLSSFSTY
jgi:hypothetical protein